MNLAVRRTPVSAGWQLHLSHPGIPETIPASVPGCVQLDLIKANLIDIRVEFDAPLTDAEKQVEKLGLYPRPYDHFLRYLARYRTSPI